MSNVRRIVLLDIHYLYNVVVRNVTKLEKYTGNITHVHKN